MATKIEYGNTLTTLLAALALLSTPAADAAAEELRDLAGEADDAWQALALGVAAEAVVKHGPGGVKMAMDEVVKLSEGKSAKLSVVDARMSHAILAAMERDEVRGRREVREWFTKLGLTMGSLGAVFLSGIVSGTLGGIKLG